MTDHRHVRLEHYVEAAKLELGRGFLAGRVHLHLIASCDVCAGEWWRLGELRTTYSARLRELRAPDVDERISNELSGKVQAIEREQRRAEELQRISKRMLNEKSRLLLTPPGKRVEMIRRAHRSFRSLLLAELLITESQKRVRNAPVEAAQIASLVPHILSWTLEPGGPTDGRELIALAAAHEANALRVSGHLDAAEQCFNALRLSLAQHPLLDLEAIAEIMSLEASLRTDQGRLDQAEALLERAATAFRYAGDEVGLGRVAIQHANVTYRAGNAAAVLPLLDTAVRALDREREPYLYLCTVTGRVNALCDLGQFDAAQQLLIEHQAEYEETEDDSYASALFRALLGRCALGQGKVAEAEELLSDASEGLKIMGRTFDAALASLDLAHALRAGGKIAELQRLARSLVADFSERRLGKEALTVLKLVASAVIAEKLTVQLLVRLRRQILASQ